MQTDRPADLHPVARLASLTVAGLGALGLGRDDGTLSVLTAQDPGYPGPLDAVLRQGPEALQGAAAALHAFGRPAAPDEVRFHPPVARADKIFCIGLNYRGHAAETGHAIPGYPAMFLRLNSGMVGHGQPLVRPRVSSEFDYEGELAVVIGTAGRHIPESRALGHVAGYSVFNDGSVRDYQMRSHQWTIGKNFDGTAGFGPWLALAGGLPPGADGLRLRTRVNGQTVQDTLTSDMIFGVARLVSMISEAVTLVPGDVIATGTPAGVGGLRKPQLFLRAGDTCEVEIEGIGTLSNPVVDEAA